jgi:hypothetical protein
MSENCGRDNYRSGSHCGRSFAAKKDSSEKGSETSEVASVIGQQRSTRLLQQRVQLRCRLQYSCRLLPAIELA